MIVNGRCLARMAALLCLATVTLALVTVPGVYALGLKNVVVWNWISDTECRATAVGDVDGDGAVEIVTGGYYNDGVRDNAQLAVWNGSTLALENVKAWYWVEGTYIHSVAIGDVDSDGGAEIVTGGYYSDGVHTIAQLVVWNGSTLALENVKAWYWGEGTYIYSVAVDDVDGDSDVEIVTGGQYYDGTYFNAQLAVWDGATLELENVAVWNWISNTFIEAVTTGDVDGDSDVEIITGGYYNDGVRTNAQLVVWDGATLTLEGVKAWYWGEGTYIHSIAVSDVDNDGEAEIVTGGDYSDGVRTIAQLVVWNGSTLALENVKAWYWGEGTYIHSIAVGDVDSDDDAEIMTGGQYYDGTNDNAQLVVWNGSTLELEDVVVWYWVSYTYILTVTAGDVDGDSAGEIVTGGYYYDNDVAFAQLVVWGST